MNNQQQPKEDYLDKAFNAVRLSCLHHGSPSFPQPLTRPPPPTRTGSQKVRRRPRPKDQPEPRHEREDYRRHAQGVRKGHGQEGQSQDFELVEGNGGLDGEEGTVCCGGDDDNEHGCWMKCGATKKERERE